MALLASARELYNDDLLRQSFERASDRMNQRLPDPIAPPGIALAGLPVYLQPVTDYAGNSYPVVAGHVAAAYDPATNTAYLNPAMIPGTQENRALQGLYRSSSTAAREAGMRELAYFNEEMAGRLADPPENEMERLFCHELAHAAIVEAGMAPYLSTEAHEGLAEAMANELHPRHLLSTTTYDAYHAQIRAALGHLGVGSAFDVLEQYPGEQANRVEHAYRAAACRN